MTTVDAAALAPPRTLTDTRSFQRYVAATVLDLFAWGLTAVAMGAAAVAVLRTPNDDWDVPR